MDTAFRMKELQLEFKTERKKRAGIDKNQN